LQQIEHELLLFALFWFLVGMLDELAVDGAWSWLRLTGRVRTGRAAPRDGAACLQGMHAVFVPAWQEADVIGATIRHMLAAWPHRELRLYIGIYRNDPATLAAAALAAGAELIGIGRSIYAVFDQQLLAHALERIHQGMARGVASPSAQFVTTTQGGQLLRVQVAPVRAAAWGSFLYLSVFSMWLGFFAWYRALALGAVRVSQLQLVQPFLSLLFAVPLAGERLDGTTLAFALAVIATVYAGKKMPIHAAGKPA